MGTFSQFRSFDEKYMILGDFYIFFIIDAICVSWFSLEFLMRFISCPINVTFFKKFLNWIDILVILAFIIDVVTRTILPKDATLTSYSTDDISFITQIIRISRLIKPLRLIARNSAGMVALGKTVKAKYKELFLVILFLGIGT